MPAASEFSLYDDADTTKILRFDLSTLQTGGINECKMPALSSAIFPAARTLAAIDVAQSWGAVQTIQDSLFDIWSQTSGIHYAFDGSLLTSARTYSFPDASGNVAVISAAQTWTAEQTFGEGRPTVAGNGADPPASGLMGKVVKTNQSAAITTTTLANGTPAGLYRVVYYLETTTANVSDGTITFQVNYTDRVGSTFQVSAASLNLSATTTGSTALSGEFVLYLASGNLSYHTNLTGSITTSRYSADVRCEFLG